MVTLSQKDASERGFSGSAGAPPRPRLTPALGLGFQLWASFPAAGFRFSNHTCIRSSFTFYPG